jgi:hypothetical protein
MGTAKLITFFELLSDGYTVAQLASAVEAHGATGWDRFGRFGAFPPKSEGSGQALDALADYFDHFAKWLNAQSDDAFSDESDVLTGSPLDDLWDRLEIGIHRFGWLEGSVPSIDRSEEHPAVPWLSPPHGQPREATMLHMLGAILALHGRRSQGWKDTLDANPSRSHKKAVWQARWRDGHFDIKPGKMVCASTRVSH